MLSRNVVIKTLTAQLTAIAKHGSRQRNVWSLVRFLLLILGMIGLYTVVFHVLMEWEGQEHSWLTGFYWTLTVMSTLGFGDITFESDLGRCFSVLVLMSGMVFLLILLPFTFIEFFYLPWIKAQDAARTPRKVDDDVRGHVIITNFNPGTRALVQRLRQHGWKYVLVAPEADEVLRLKDDGYEVVLGKVDDPDTYRALRVNDAAMVVATSTDVVNSHIALTVREISTTVPIVCSADKVASVDLLELAGANHVLRFEQLMGSAFARWSLGGKTEANVIGQMEGVLVAEASAFGTPLVGKTLQEIRLRERFGVTVAGVWKRGHFEPSGATTRVDANTVLVLVGSKEHLAAYDSQYSQYGQHDAPVLILGGGRVGCATAKTLEEAQREYCIVEKDPQHAPSGDRVIVGDAADLDVLKRAGIDEAKTVIVTTHDDDVNVYLTVYCRKLRPDAQVIARATRERTIPSLHRAGADFVLSYASMGASAMLNLLKQDKVLLVAEGLDFFRVPVPRSLAGTKIGECGIRERTGCSVVAVKIDGDMQLVPDPTEPLPAGGEMLLIGTVQAEERFLELFRG